MSEWKEYKIGDIIVLEYGKALKDYQDNLGEFNVYGTNGLIGKTGKYLYDQPSLIIGRKGAYREVHYTSSPFFVIDTAFYTKNKFKNLNTKFLYYWFKNIDINLMDSGSAIPSTSRDEVYDLDIRLPDEVEQQSIACILSSLDDKIDLLQQQNQTLEKMAETLFRQWFVEEAKEDWENTTLDKHIEAFRGLSYKGSGLAEKGIGLPMHNLNSVNEGGGYKYEGIKYYTGEYKERHLIQPGNIIVTNTEQGHDFRLIGFPAIVPETFGSKGLFSQHIYKIVPLHKSYLSNEFIYYLLMVPSVREQITAATNGSTVNMLAIDGLERPEFQLPPKELVDDFSLIVSNYWKKKTINLTQIRSLTALRDSLLPKLISGELRLEIN